MATLNDKLEQTWCLEIIDNINRIMAREVELEIHMVPGHQSVMRNKRAEQLAKERAAGTARDPSACTMRTFLTKAISQELGKEWEHQWKRSKNVSGMEAPRTINYKIPYKLNQGTSHQRSSSSGPDMDTPSHTSAE